MLAYDKRLQLLLTTAARIFAERGYQATPMRDLSKASGLSLAGIYHYVGSKLELLYLIQDRCFTQVICGRPGGSRHPGEEPEARLGAFIHHHVIFFAAHMDEMKVLSHESDELEGTMRAQLRRRKRDYANLLQELLDAGARGPGLPSDGRLRAVRHDQLDLHLVPSNRPTPAREAG